ncbi:MinD/ParA family ATP-binding protein [Arcanobacterium haemolyticum]|uniref:Uncharacterized protein n=1 Tax=Arcanobacterium haemolyticum (strain ATCC 9345 / DSM 20595 / CCM 5947 / CCUG 17215 / LMG 16163 / NBRC 15585 / NCTC 8452 / 11018) TaxID=644284 RepID=D7BMC6_ARCHD|nr:hypothetical protein [Arcanobacterium haemolyticum]ADH92075.1 hypothetical protein Arch_0317 [Arcanobacterium haemolyticum DSM 20595]
MSAITCLPSRLDTDVISELTHTGDASLVVRRCADMAEVLAAARARIASVAIIAEDVDFLDVTLLSDLRQYLAVAIVVGTGSTRSIDVRSLGSVEVFSPHAADIANRIRASVGSHEYVPSFLDDDADRDVSKGAFVAFWGPFGSHGRSCLVRDSAAILSKEHDVIVVDADSMAPSLAQVFDVDESSDLIGLARMIDQGRKIELELCVTRPVSSFGNVRLVTGMNTGQRWREVSRPVADRLWPLLSSGSDLVLADVTGGMDERAERVDRWALSRSAMDSADALIHVASATPSGLRRLIEHFDELRDREPGRDAIVLTGVRSSALGVGLLAQARDVLDTVGIGDVPVFGVREERSILDKALIDAQAVPYARPKCGYTKDVGRICEWIKDRMRVCASISH